MSLCRTSTVVWFAFFINLMITGANAARLADAQLQQLQDPLEPKQQLRRNELLTYYFDASKPQVSLGDHGTGRPGRTALSLTLSQPSISTYMPVVSPRASGMTHQVSKTWEVLKVCLCNGLCLRCCLWGWKGAAAQLPPTAIWSPWSADATAGGRSQAMSCSQHRCSRILSFVGWSWHSCSSIQQPLCPTGPEGPSWWSQSSLQLPCCCLVPALI